LFSFQLYCLVCSNTLHNIKSDQLFILFWNSKWKKIVFDYGRLFYSIFCLFILFSHSFIKIQTTFAIKSIGRCCFFLIQYCKIIYFWHVFFNFVICLTSNSFSGATFVTACPVCVCNLLNRRVFFVLHTSTLYYDYDKRKTCILISFFRNVFCISDDLGCIVMLHDCNSAELPLPRQ
jgi:hypothetical protein